MGFGLWKKAREAESQIQSTVERVLREALSGAGSAIALAGDLAKIKKELEDLKIEKSRILEEHEKRNREIEHKIGLERKRQEFEIDQAKREASVSVREENLKADQKRFESQLDFHEKRFAEEVGYLKSLMGEIIQRMPSAEIQISRRDKPR